MQTPRNDDGAGRPLQGTPTPLRRGEQSTPRAPRLPRCGVCDGTEPVIHCQNCDLPTCSTHILRVFGCEGEPASYLCTLCAEDLWVAAGAPDLASLAGTIELPAPRVVDTSRELIGVAPWA